MPILANRKHELIAQALAEGKSQTQAFIAAGYSERERTPTAHACSHSTVTAYNSG